MIAGIVLAAGRSSRMGEPKALLRLDGLTFLERAVTLLRGAGCDPVLAVVNADDIAQEATRVGAGVVVNRMRDAEQVDSLRVGLRALGPEVAAALVHPVDVPDADAAGRVVEAFRATGAPIVLPAHDGRHGHPVLFARAVWPELLAPDLPEGARTVVHAHRADLLEVPVAELPADVDTPGDYRRLLEQR